MRFFLYEYENGVELGMTNEDDIQNVISQVAPKDVDVLILDSSEIPIEPQETWYIEDGKIKIDQVKLIEFNRKNMPQLTPIEFDIKLNNAGLYDTVQDLIKDSFELRIAYNRATFFNRTSPFIDEARIALGLTDEQVDAMWMN